MHVLHTVVAFLLQDAVFIMPDVVSVQGIIVIGFHSVVVRKIVIAIVLCCSAVVVVPPPGVVLDAPRANRKTVRVRFNGSEVFSAKRPGSLPLSVRRGRTDGKNLDTIPRRMAARCYCTLAATALTKSFLQTALFTRQCAKQRRFADSQ